MGFLFTITTSCTKEEVETDRPFKECEHSDVGTIYIGNYTSLNYIEIIVNAKYDSPYNINCNKTHWFSAKSGKATVHVNNNLYIKGTGKTFYVNVVQCEDVTFNVTDELLGDALIKY